MGEETSRAKVAEFVDVADLGFKTPCCQLRGAARNWRTVVQQGTKEQKHHTHMRRRKKEMWLVGVQKQITGNVSSTLNPRPLPSGNHFCQRSTGCCPRLTRSQFLLWKDYWGEKMEEKIETNKQYTVIYIKHPCPIFWVFLPNYGLHRDAVWRTFRFKSIINDNPCNA